MKVSKVAIFFSFLMMVYSQYSLAAPQIGQMVWVNGTVKAGARVLQRRSPVYEHDAISTNSSSTGQIVFTDGSTFALRANTIFRVDEYKLAPGSPRENKFVSNLVIGGFRTITGYISKANPNGYAVKTPVATIGVRGTDYSLAYQSRGGLTVKLDRGSVSVGNQTGVYNLTKSAIPVVVQIASRSRPPERLKTIPAVFRDQPPITPVPKPASLPMAPGESSTGIIPSDGVGEPANRPAKQVKEFCIQ